MKGGVSLIQWHTQNFKTHKTLMKLDLRF